MFLPSFQRDSLPDLQDCQLATYASELYNVGIATGCAVHILELKLRLQNLHPLVPIFLLYSRNEYNVRRLDQTSSLFATRRGGAVCHVGPNAQNRLWLFAVSLVAADLTYRCIVRSAVGTEIISEDGLMQEMQQDQPSAARPNSIPHTTGHGDCSWSVNNQLTN